MHMFSIVVRIVYAYVHACTLLKLSVDHWSPFYSVIIKWNQKKKPIAETVQLSVFYSVDSIHASLLLSAGRRKLKFDMYIHVID